MCEFDLSTVSLVSLGPWFFSWEDGPGWQVYFLGLIFENSPELPEPHPRTEVLNDVSVLLDALKLKGEKLEEAARPGRRLSVLLHEFWERSPIENPWLSNGKSTSEMEVLIGKCPIRSYKLINWGNQRTPSTKNRGISQLFSTIWTPPRFTWIAPALAPPLPWSNCSCGLVKQLALSPDGKSTTTWGIYGEECGCGKPINLLESSVLEPYWTYYLGDGL